MVVVPGPKTTKSAGVVTHNDRVHALRHGGLPGVVLAEAVGGAALAKSDTLRVLAADGLPAESAKCVAHRIAAPAAQARMMGHVPADEQGLL